MTDEARFCRAPPCATLGPSLLVARDHRGVHVTTPAGFILSTGHSRWREGAHRLTMRQPPAAFAIKHLLDFFPSPVGCWNFAVGFLVDIILVSVLVVVAVPTLPCTPPCCSISQSP